MDHRLIGLGGNGGVYAIDVESGAATLLGDLADERGMNGAATLEEHRLPYHGDWQAIA